MSDYTYSAHEENTQCADLKTTTTQPKVLVTTVKEMYSNMFQACFLNGRTEPGVVFHKSATALQLGFVGQTARKW